MATPIPQNVAPFTLDEVLSSTSGHLARPAQSGEVRVLGVATDSREVILGKAFVALRGERFDAHDFLADAARGEPSILLVEDCAQTRQFVRSYHGAAQVVLVHDTLVALGELARFHRQRWAGKLVAVAGSAGKTTTKSVISALLEAKQPGRILKTLGNLNNRIGVPMTLFGLSPAVDIAVIEVGTNQPGEVGALVRLCRPDVSVLTLIDLEHTEGLGDLDGVEAEEGAVFAGLDEDSAAIGYGDDDRVLRQLEGCSAGRRYTYGERDGSSLRLVERVMTSPSQTRLQLAQDGEAFFLSTSLMGLPGALAISAGLLTLCALGLVKTFTPTELALFSEALEGVGEPGRGTLVPHQGGLWILDDTYNSNPASVVHSIACGKELAQKAGGRLFLVLGEMLELGALSADAHSEMGVQASEAGAFRAFFVQGDAKISFNIGQERGLSCRFFEDAGEVGREIHPLLASGDVVVVKASRGVRAERVVQELARHFGPRELS